MSHIVEVYAKDLGVKVGKPVITEHFVSGVPDNYVTFQTSNKMPAADYKYWDIVISLIKPSLVKAGINIVQVGGPKDPKIKGADAYFLGSSYRQMNYIIKGSKTHFSPDSLTAHVASAYDIPSVVVHFNLYPENSKPVWHNHSECVSLSPDFSEIKPSFSTDCNRINEIMPETIANAVLRLLGLEETKFQTVRIGSLFQNEVVEIVPNFFAYSKELEGQPVNIKADLHFNVENIVNWSRMCVTNIHLNKPLELGVIDFCDNLKQVVFKYDSEHEEMDLNPFFAYLKKKKINLLIRVQDKDILSDVRFKYFDYVVILDDRCATIEEEIPENCKYLSKKRFVTGSEVFPAEFAAKTLDKTQRFVQNDVSKSEIESLYLYVERD